MIESYIRNVFLAGWCADAVGARLEFRRTRYSEKEVVDAMHFRGEKTNGIQEGQYTDDTEMEIALLSALVECKDAPYFPIEEIAKGYLEWYNSMPIDMGQSISMALSNAENADDMVNNALEYNENSESNGSLMRCVPIAVFSLFKDDALILEIAELEASLTHASSVVKVITGIYCCILSKMMSETLKGNPIQVEELVQDIKRLAQGHDARLVDWWKEGMSLTDVETYDAITNEGHVKHAFIFMVYFVKNMPKYTYERAIREVLQCGGDTDTNAKIIGPLFGAYYNDCIPESMSTVVLKFEGSQSGDGERPMKYGIQHGIELIEETYRHVGRKTSNRS